VIPFLALVLLLQAAQATDSAVGPPETRPAIRLERAQGLAADVFYLTVPWGPNTFASMESPGDGYYNRRSWPFARLETRRPVTVDGVPVPIGNHALVFHPNTPDDEGMSLEVRQIDAAEFLEEGNAMTRTPEGRTLWRAPVRFDTAAGTAPALKVGMVPEEGGFRLEVQYGDRRTTKQFRYPASESPGQP